MPDIVADASGFAALKLSPSLAADDVAHVVAPGSAVNVPVAVRGPDPVLAWVRVDMGNAAGDASVHWVLVRTKAMYFNFDHGGVTDWDLETGRCVRETVCYGSGTWCACSARGASRVNGLRRPPADRGSRLVFASLS